MMVKFGEPPTFTDSSEKEEEGAEESPRNSQEIPEDQPSGQDTPPTE